MSVSHEGLCRRAFLGGATALGASAILAAETEQKNVATFAKRGWYERLNVAYAEVHLGLPKPFSILHVTDTHLTAAYPRETAWQKFAAQRTQIFGGHQEEALKDTLDWARQNVPLVVHTGDLIDFVTEANLDKARAICAATPELFAIPGNHEFHYLPNEKGVEPTFAYNARGAAALRKVYGDDPLFRTRVVGGVNFVLMDNSYGLFCEEQVARFKAEVARGLPIVLGLHVPIYTDRIRRAAYRYWGIGKMFDSAALPPPSGDSKRQTTDPLSRDFVDYLRKEPLLKCVLAGHVHHSADDRFSPTACEYVLGGNFFYFAREILFT